MAEASNFAFGELLRFWRELRSLSQESLAHEAESSPRHISRLETGKAMPSLAMIDKLALVLKLGGRDAGYLYLAAGQVPRAQAIEFAAPKYGWLRKAMARTLKALDPHPSVLMDRFGQILMVNKAWAAFQIDSVASAGMASIVNYNDFLFRQQSFSDAQELRMNSLALILMAIKQESLLTKDPQYGLLLSRLLTHEQVPDDWQQRAANLEPMSSFRVQFEQSGSIVSYFNVSQTIGAMGPVSFVSEPRLIMTTLFPEDENLEQGLPPEVSPHPLLFY